MWIHLQLVWKLSSCTIVVKFLMVLTGLRFIPVFTCIVRRISQALGLNFAIHKSTSLLLSIFWNWKQTCWYAILAGGIIKIRFKRQFIYMAVKGFFVKSWVYIAVVCNEENLFIIDSVEICGQKLYAVRICVCLVS